MSEISSAFLGDVAKIQQGRYLAKGDMGELPSTGQPIPVHGANGVIGWTETPMYLHGIPLVTCRGSNSGMVSWAEGPLWISNNAMAVLPKPQHGNLRFLYYALLSNPPYAVVTGSAQPQITRIDFSTFRIPYTDDKYTQDKIALILGVLDDKIELNQRTNETLYAMVHGLFKDWFVDFGPTRGKMEGRTPYLAPDIWALFPDCINGETRLPEGW